MIHIQTLTRKLNRPTAFREEYIIIHTSDNALIGQNGKVMMERLDIHDPRTRAYREIEELDPKAQEQSESHILPEIPITYVIALTYQTPDGKSLLSRVARFACFETARTFMKRHSLYMPHFKVVAEKCMKQCAAQHYVVPITGRIMSRRKDWMRRGVLIPEGHFKGKGTLHKFHHRNRMIRDQAYAHFRHMGILNPSRGEINALFQAELAPLRN